VNDNRRGNDLRVKASFRVRFATVDDLVLAYTGNLSRGGMRLRTDQDIALGSVIEVRLELPDEAPEVRIPSEVVSVTPDGTTGRKYLGVRFIDPDESARKRLEWFILNSEPAPGQFGPATHGQQLKLLIVDDEPLQRASTAKPFQERGHDVRLASDGLAALGLALKDPPDVVLTDLQMPKMDGWQLLRMLRSRPALASVPVIFLTTLSGESDRLLGYRMGVDDFIAKPPEPGDLLARVDRAALRAMQMKASGRQESTDALRGDLEQVSLPAVLSFLEMERKTGVLRVGTERFAVLYLREGRPLRARASELSGATPMQHAHAILSISRGRFEFVPEDVAGPDELKVTVAGLLLEHARLTDEAAR